MGRTVTREDMEILDAVLGRRSGERSFRFQEVQPFFKKVLERQGCLVLDKGWPDFLVRYSDGKIKAIEVKRDKIELKFFPPQQREMHRLLEEAGIPVEVWCFEEMFGVIKTK